MNRSVTFFLKLCEQLVELPCSPNVDDILKKYTESKMTKHGM